MELTDELVRELQVSLTLRTLPQVIKELCSEPEGIFAELLLANKHGINANAKHLLQKLDNGLHWFVKAVGADGWLKSAIIECCGKETSKNIDQQKSLLAEINAYLQLSYCFKDQAVEQLDENDGKDGKTPDFKVGSNLYVEVYCPDKALSHKKAVSSLAANFKKQEGFGVETLISRPVTGNALLSKKYASNQVLNRIVSAKRANDQTVANSNNILWLNLSNKLNLDISHTLPIKTVSKCNDNFIGANGIWHSFYGEKEKSIFAFEGHSLRLPCNSRHYFQKQNEGLFRERATLSAAIIECTDGVAIYQNPWASKKLEVSTITSLFKLHSFRPEYSWLDTSNSTCLKDVVSAELEKHLLLIKPLE